MYVRVRSRALPSVFLQFLFTWHGSNPHSVVQSFKCGVDLTESDAFAIEQIHSDGPVEGGDGDGPMTRDLPLASPVVPSGSVAHWRRQSRHLWRMRVVKGDANTRSQ